MRATHQSLRLSVYQPSALSQNIIFTIYLQTKYDLLRLPFWKEMKISFKMAVKLVTNNHHDRTSTDLRDGLDGSNTVYYSSIDTNGLVWYGFIHLVIYNLHITHFKYS